MIVTDDGAAMGMTLEAALWSARREKPNKLIAAIPVSPSETIRRLAKSADETICLSAPEGFSAVSQFYLSFPEVEDREIEKILQAETGRRHQARPSGS